MGAHTDYVAEAQLEETLKDGTTVAAATGYFVLDERYPDQSPEPVIAWRVGNERVLPITRCGVVCRECWVAYPDGRVRHHHGSPCPSLIPEFANVAEWRTSSFGPEPPYYGRKPPPPGFKSWGSPAFEKALDEIDAADDLRYEADSLRRTFHVVADADPIRCPALVPAADDIPF